jgi:molybdopterin converting factor small subunit
MVVKILSFGVLKDLLPAEITIHNEEIDLESFQKLLKENYSSIAKYDFTVAVNHAIVNRNVTLKNGDVIALMPPFSGG